MISLTVVELPSNMIRKTFSYASGMPYYFQVKMNTKAMK